jgi:hypothetical protein
VSRGPRRWAPGETWKPAGEGDGDPGRLDGSLDALARGLGIGRGRGAAPAGRGLADLHARWAEVVGEGTVDHATPGALKGGRLTIDVDHPAWATSLAHLEAKLLERIAAVAGAGLVQGIDLRVRPRRDGG